MSSRAPTAFISYKWETEEHNAWVKSFAEDLQGHGIEPHLDRWEVRPGDSLTDYMASRISRADAFLFVMTSASVAAVEAEGNSALKFELQLAMARERAGEKIRVIGIYREGDRPAAHLRDRLYADFRDSSRYSAKLRELADDLLGRPPALKPFPELPGVVERARAFDRKAPLLPNQVFAIELLTKPVRLTRLDDGRISVSIDRSGVSGAVVTSQARRNLCNHYLGSLEVRREARRLDARIHQFLLGRSHARSLEISLDRWPLRWASGGVLSVVRLDGREWTPFFFRDIKPWGWNISLGGSEREDDLGDPWTFQFREFFEETLVLDAPPRVGRIVNSRHIALYRSSYTRERALADRFSAAHRELRREKDDVYIQAPPVPDPREITARVGTTAMQVVISGKRTREHPDVLVCINLLELGIEVVKVVRFELGASDYILDGEAYALDAGTELVRMPVALISHAYLREAFGNPERKLEYVGKIQPSVKTHPIGPHHIRLFPFDVERRLAIADGTARGSAWERKRYTLWKTRFPEFLADGRVPLFTPAAAKILSYYFADRERRLGAP
ncbi:MAG TPA: toll/interleukin-1 receptor domain-containing protein [Longimicrobiaceae bacterium]|nr:toll/interleukin-1 receptor domain-containing protein [Longimicrobiaceae bacterium]